jgi:hypothetical protein
MRLSAILAASILISTAAFAAEQPTASSRAKTRVLSGPTPAARPVSIATNVSPLVRAANATPKAKSKIKITQDTLVKTGGRITTTDSTWEPKIANESAVKSKAPDEPPPAIDEAELLKKAAELRAEHARLAEQAVEGAEDPDGVEDTDAIDSRMREIMIELQKLQSQQAEPDGR